ncbi:hypothetical protein LZ30DRAFT_341175 [Colletotrichum cereale]|nr:hypothetical protein LZ30DRAFT_341175 [Colletotrichum cereale]
MDFSSGSGGLQSHGARRASLRNWPHPSQTVEKKGDAVPPPSQPGSLRHPTLDISVGGCVRLGLWHVAKGRRSSSRPGPKPIRVRADRAPPSLTPAPLRSDASCQRPPQAGPSSPRQCQSRHAASAYRPSPSIAKPQHAQKEDVYSS